MHPLILKWMRHKHTTKVEFDYCQFGTAWRKPTSALAFNNIRFKFAQMRPGLKQTTYGKSLLSVTCYLATDVHALS